MSRIHALRTYTFISPEAALDFSSGFKAAAASMKREREHNTLIKGYWFSTKNRAQVHCLLHYPPGSDPEQIRMAYVTSEAFKKDSGGKDVKAILVSLEEVVLDSIDIGNVE